MRSFVAGCLALGLALAHAPTAAQEAETLRKELEEMRKQFETMKDQYQRAIEAMSERLQRLEAQPKPVAAPPVALPPAAQAPAPSQPSLAELARPREPFSLYGRRGAGQLLFDMGVAGDFVANLTQRNVAKTAGGSFPNRENRFFPREIDFGFFGQIDPYARADVFIAAAEERAGAETRLSIEEAKVTLLTLPFGTQVTFGQMHNRFGYANLFHDHDLPWIDRPNVLRDFLGDGGLIEKGAELTVVPDLPVYLEGLVGVFNGDNDTAFGRGTLKSPLLTGRLRTFFELGAASAIQLGLSGARGETPGQRRSGLVGLDARYKYRPLSSLWPLLTLTGEAIFSERQVNFISPDTGVSQTRFRDRFGWYLGGEVQPFRRWAVGLRYDDTQFPVNPGRESAVEPFVTFWPSEFLRFRLGYKHTDRSHRDGFTSSARIVDESLLQGTFILGAHPAHPF